MITCIFSNTIVQVKNYQYNNQYNTISTAQFVATVVSNETRKEYTSVYQIKIESINGNTSYRNAKVFLKIKEEGILQYGDYIRFQGDYQKPQTARNEKGFDYEEYLKSMGIFGTVETSKNSLHIEKKGNLPLIFLLANQIRGKLLNQCNKILPKENAILLQGILLGETHNLEEVTIKNFRGSSLYHMLAVSGMHISYLILACQLVFGKFGVRNRNIITIGFLIFFMLINNVSISVVRACVMGIIVLLAEVLYQKPDFINTISIALLVILLQNPYVIKSLSVLLSFGGTLGIIVFSKDFKILLQKEGIQAKPNKIKNYIKQNMMITISAQLMVVPVTLFYFHTISITFPLSNILASILIGPIIILGFLSICFSLFGMVLARVVAIPLNIFLWILQQIANITANFPFSNIYIISIPIFFFILYYGVSYLSYVIT